MQAQSPDFRTLAPLIKALRDAKNPSPGGNDPSRTFAFGTVVMTYSDGCTILFDGETQSSIKHYRWLDQVPPLPGSRVMLASVANTWVIVGSLDVQPYPVVADTSWHYIGVQGEIQFTASADVYGKANNGGSVYGNPRYSKDETGCVWLEGLLAVTAPGSAQLVTLFVLPPGYRPAYTLVFTAVVNSSAEGTFTGQIYIYTDGTVQLASPADGAAFLSLDNVTFMAEDQTDVPWVDLTSALTANASRYADHRYAPPRCYQDSAGDVHLSGLLTINTAGNAIQYLTLPAGYGYTGAEEIYATMTQAGAGRIDAVPTGGNANLITGYVATAGQWLSLDGVVLTGAIDTVNNVHPWRVLTMQNSWANYGSVFSGLDWMMNRYGTVSLRGLIKGGTAGSLLLPSPPGWAAPAYDKLFLLQAGGPTGALRLDVLGTNSLAGTPSNLIARTYINGGSNNYVATGNVRWRARSRI